MSLKLKWALALLFLFAGVAEAATYDLPASLKSSWGCSINGSTVTCNNFNLNNNDEVTVTGNITLKINGSASVQNAKINVGGGASKLTINAANNLTSDTGVKIEANIIASAGKVTLGYNGTLIGNITANSATFGGENTMTGSVNVASSVNSTGSNVAISGGIEADSITLGNGSSVGGLINTINLATGSHVLLSNVNAQTVSLGSSNAVNGFINASNTVTTGSGTQITGNIHSPTVTLGSANTLNGSIDATDITIQASNSVVNGNLNASNNINLGSGTHISGNISAGGHITTTSPVTLAGDISAGGDFNLASGSTVLGNIDADNITMAPSSSTVTGELSAVNKVILGSGNTVVGDVYGKTITLESSTGRIEGNATATEIVTINWHGVITGNVTAPHIENNGGTIIGDIFCDTRNGLIRECNTDSGGNSGDSTGGLASCTGFNEMIGSGVIGGTNGNPNFSYGSGSTINGLPITGSGGNSPTPNGQVAVVPTNFPSLDPEIFPSNSNFGGPGQKNIQGIPPGSYGTIRTTENGSTSTSGGGTYYINKLSLEEKSSITLGSGDYFIKAVELKEKSEIIIVPGAKVRILIAPDGEFEVDEKVEINKYGEVSGLAIYLYADAEFAMEEKGYFKGLIYSPFTDTKIEFEDKSIIEGAIISAGEVELEDKVSVIFTEDTLLGASEAAGCDASSTEPVVDHFRILNPASQVSCMAAPVTIQACANASCTALYPGVVTTNISSSNPAAHWNGTTANTAGITFNGGEATVGLSLVAGGQTTLSLNNFFPTAINNNFIQCNGSGGNIAPNCNIEFKTAGLMITNVDGSQPINSPFAGSDLKLAIRAVETDLATGACLARVSGNRPVQFAVECTNPSSCVPGETFEVNEQDILANNAPINLDFDENDPEHKAVFTANYSDVGQLQLHASLDLPSAPTADPNVTDPATTLTGSGSFVVRPHKLIVQGLDDSGDLVLATKSEFKAAGEPFNVAILSLNENGDVTPNFGNENTAVQGSVAFDSVAFPTNGYGESSDLNVSDLNSSSHPDLAGTLMVEGAVWNEAGTVNLRAGLANNKYLGVIMGDPDDTHNPVVLRPPSPVGRFYPHHFVVASSLVSNSCEADSFSYLGQPKIGINFTLHALNAGGSLVKNYGHGNYAGIATISAAAIDTANNLPAGRLIADVSATWNKGVYQVALIDAEISRFFDNIPDGPFGDTHIQLTISDAEDGRVFATGATEDLSDDTLNLKYGRMVLENIYGPEDVQLNVQLKSEYWDGKRFVLHSADSCTMFENENSNPAVGLNVVSDPASLNPVSSDISSGTLANGAVVTRHLYWLPPSGTNQRGKFEFEYNAPEWLRFDWGRTGAVGSNQNPQATGTFGQYRGNDRIIFSLERNL